MKLNVYDDREESHYGAFKGSMFDKIITVKEFLCRQCKKICQEQKG